MLSLVCNEILVVVGGDDCVSISWWLLASCCVYFLSIEHDMSFLLDCSLLLIDNDVDVAVVVRIT